MQDILDDLNKSYEYAKSQHKNMQVATSRNFAKRVVLKKSLSTNDLYEYQMIDNNTQDIKGEIVPFRNEFLQNSNLVIIDKKASDMELPH